MTGFHQQTTFGFVFVQSGMDEQGFYDIKKMTEHWNCDSNQGT